MVKIKRRASTNVDPFVESGQMPSYRDVATLSNYMKARSGISARFYTNLSAKSQRRIAKAIKRARHLGLLPFVTVVA